MPLGDFATIAFLKGFRVVYTFSDRQKALALGVPNLATGIFVLVHFLSQNLGVELTLLYFYSFLTL